MSDAKSISSSVSFFKYPFHVLFFVILMQLLSHYNHSPLWLVMFVVAIACFGLFTYKIVSRNVSPSVRMALVVLSVVVFFLYYRVNFTVDMAASFLVLVSALKFLELRSK